MAGYSGTPLTKKLGIKAMHRVALLHAPANFPALLNELPDAEQHRGLVRDLSYEVILLFCIWLEELEAGFQLAASHLTPAGGLWVCWPKKAAKVPTDLTEGVVRQVGLDAGLVDNKVCALDETWSALRFVVRRQDRPKPAATKRHS